MPQGFRAFDVRGDGEDELFLRSSTGLGAGRAVPLEYPATEAVCSDHRAPGPNHGCGYYAYSWLGGSKDYMKHGTANVMAEVWGHGRVEVHEHGWRAQRMQIVRFYYPLCDFGDQSRFCMRPAISWFDAKEGGWPKPLHLACENHPMESRLIDEYDDEESSYSEGEQVSLELVTDVPILARPIESFIRLLAEKFEASVFDIDATLKVFQHNKEWREQMAQIQVERNEAAERKREEQELRRTAARVLPGLMADVSDVLHAANCRTRFNYGGYQRYGCTCQAQKWVTA